MRSEEAYIIFGGEDRAGSGKQPIATRRASLGGSRASSLRASERQRVQPGRLPFSENPAFSPTLASLFSAMLHTGQCMYVTAPAIRLPPTEPQPDAAVTMHHDVGPLLLLPDTAPDWHQGLVHFLRLGEQYRDHHTRPQSPAGTLLPKPPCRRHARPDFGQTPNRIGRRAGWSPDVARCHRRQG